MLPGTYKAPAPRIYPLVNKTALFDLTPDDLIRPAEFGLLQSTVPLFIVFLNVAAFIVWLVILLYFWKLVYYQVNDPYATSLGSSPPNFNKRSLKALEQSLWIRVIQAIENYSKNKDQIFI